MKFDLVFEGGGAKGMGFVGALRAMEEAGHTPGRLLGTSAGAITAALLAAGYTVDEMTAALSEQAGGRSVFAGFMQTPAPVDRDKIGETALRTFLRQVDLSWLPNTVEDRLDDMVAHWVATSPSLRSVNSFIERGGWYSADNFVAWMKRLLDSGTFRGAPRAFGAMTLAQYRDATGADLSLVASDTTAGEMLILNRKTAPEVPVVWAVRMSMNIPLLWQEVIWEEAWGTYRGTPRAGHAIVDGGLLSNFPLELLISRDKRVTDLMGERISGGVLGLLLDEAASVPGLAAPATAAGSSLMSTKTVTRITHLINTALGARDKLVIDAFERLVARLPAGGVGTTEFDMSDERRAKLVDAGYAAMSTFLEGYEPPAISFDGNVDPATRHAEVAADRLSRRLLGG